MSKRLKIISIAILISVFTIGSHLLYLMSLSAKEVYAEDNFFATESNKTALIIVAHDDDMASSAGTMSMLSKNGWAIREMCFYKQGGYNLQRDSTNNPIRKKSLQNVADIQGLQGINPVDFNFRNDTMTETPYMPIPYSTFPESFKMDSLTGYISRFIETYKPSVIFTLDNVIGGYGHPEHVVISQLVLQYCDLHKNDPGFSVKKIYQAVFSPSLAESINSKMPVYIAAKKVYQTSGMPPPDVQVTISDYAQQKKAVMTAYTTEQNSLRKIWPYYHWYPASIYFKIFDREFFRVLDVRGGQ